MSLILSQTPEKVDVEGDHLVAILVSCATLAIPGEKLRKNIAKGTMDSRH